MFPYRTECSRIRHWLKGCFSELLVQMNRARYHSPFSCLFGSGTPINFSKKKYFWYHGWWLGGGGRRFCRWLQQMVCWDGCSLQFGGVWPSLACRCFHPHKFNYKSFISIHDTLTSVGRDTAYRMWDQSFISIHDTLKLVGRDTAYRMWDQSLISFHDTLTSVGRDTAYRMWDQSLISFHDTRWHRLGETLHTGCETNL